MGYELKQLMKMYGVSTPTMAPAPQMPGAAPTALAQNATAEQQAKYAADKAAFDESVRRYNLNKAQYDQYARDYQNRLANTNIYNQAQFSTTGANVPPIMTYSDGQVTAPPTGTQYGTPQWSNMLQSPVYEPLTAMNVAPPTSVVPPVNTMSPTTTPPMSPPAQGGGRDRDGISGLGGLGGIGRPGNGTGTGSFGLPDPFGGGSRAPSFGGYTGLRDMFDGGGPGRSGTRGGYTGLRDMFDGGGPGRSGTRGGYTGLRDMFDGGGPGRSRAKAAGGYIQNYAEGGDVANSPAKMSGLGAKPNMKEFMDATGVDSKTAAQILYGSIGSNRDIRDWNAIMAATKPVQAAQAATGQMYSTGAPIATDQRFYKDGAYNPGAMSTQYAVTDVAGSGGPRLQTINGTLMIVDKSGLPLTQLTPENAAFFGVAQDTINTAISSGAIQGGDERVNAFKVAGFQPYEAGNFLRADYGSLLGAPLEQGNNLAQAERTWGMAPLSSPQIQNVNAPQNYAEGGTVRGYAPGGTISGGAGDDVLMGRPAGDMLTPAPAPVVEDPQDAMMAMLARYAAPVDRSAEIAAANERVAAERKAFEEMLLGQLDAQDNAPQSKAEMYFRLAAAFGAPTKTGHFSENLALVGQTMADELAAKAKREREAREKKLGVRTELQKMRMEAAGEELGTLRGLQEDETKYGRELSRDLIKDYIASGKPQSEAGRIAMDMGLKPGTPEFNDEVRKQTELKIQRELAAIQAQIASTASSTAAAGRMSSTEINLRTETENNLANLNQAISDVAEAYRLNPNSYSGSLTDMAVRKLQETVGSDDPMIVNTRRIENLLGQQALGTLKAVFGGNPTEGERAILLELQGIGAKSLEERSEIMLRLYEVLQERQARETKRLDDILSGAYRSYTPIEGGE